jgi:uncharacterized repeat protein (TIGR01451 family)
MMKKVLILTTTALLLATTIAWAAPKIEIALTAEVEVKAMVDGKEVITRVPAAEAEPGEIIYYTLTYRNSGDQAATEVKLNDPIPKETQYLTGSAFGVGAKITFSADGGVTYQEPTLVTFKITNADGTTSVKSASPDQYTDIRWTVGTIPAGSSGTVGFAAVVR